MATHLTIQMDDPSLSLVKDPSNEGNAICTLLNIGNAYGDTVTMHFDSDKDFEAFVGLMNMAIGK